MNDEQNLERIIALLDSFPIPANISVTADDGYIYFALTNVTPLLSEDPPVHGATLPPGTPVDMAKPHLTPAKRTMLVAQGTLLAITPAELAEARQIQMGRHRAALREAENQARIAQGLPPLVDEPKAAITAKEVAARAEEVTPEEAVDFIETFVEKPALEPDTVRLSRRQKKSDSTPEEN